MPKYEKMLELDPWLWWFMLVVGFLVLGITGILVGIIIYASQIAHSLSSIHHLLVPIKELIPCWQAACI